MRIKDAPFYGQRDKQNDDYRYTDRQDGQEPTRDSLALVGVCYTDIGGKCNTFERRYKFDGSCADC